MPGTSRYPWMSHMENIIPSLGWEIMRKKTVLEVAGPKPGSLERAVELQIQSGRSDYACAHVFAVYFEC